MSNRDTNRRWLILVVGYASTIAAGTILVSVPPVLSLIMAELNLSYAQGGLLMSLVALPGILFCIPAGMLADRYGQKVISIVSFAFIVAGTAVFASGDSLFTLLLGRILSGIGAIILTVVVPQMVAQWFSGREIGTAMGIYCTAMPASNILALNLLSFLGEILGWRASIWLSMVFPLLALIVLIALFKEAPRDNQRRELKAASPFSSMRHVGISIYLVGCVWMLFNSAYYSFVTFTPDFLQKLGYGFATSGLLTGIILWPTIPLSTVAGYAMQKIGHKRTFIVGTGLALAVLLWFFPLATDYVVTLIVLGGVIIVFLPVAVFALAAEVVSPEKVGLGYGISQTLLNIGMLLAPALTGLARDLSGNYQASYALMSLFSLLIIVPALLLGWKRRSSHSLPQ